MAKIYYDTDASLDSIRDLNIGVIGYGNQGRAHALNLRDSGLPVRVGFRADSASKEKAIRDGFEPEDIETIAANCDLLAIMLPDEAVLSVYTDAIEPYLSSHRTFVFAHGFCVHHKTIRLPDDADIVLVAPTGPGRQLRSLYQAGRGLPALVAVEQDASGVAFDRCLAYARGIGSGRAGCVKTTFAEETVTDLFCEQAVLCGGIPQLIKSSFNTLVENGYQPELAYISCLKEVKLIADLLFDSGIDGMRQAISTTARFGSAITGPELINEDTHRRLQHVLERIESGSFAQRFIDEARHGLPSLKDLMAEEKHSKIVRTGRQLKDTLDF
jgi:ketol-acid reductoisomerase